MRRIIFFICVVLFAACSQKSEKDGIIKITEVLDFEKQEMGSISDCVDSVTYLPLKLTQEALFRNIDKMLCENGMMYIGDFRTRKITVCNMSGNVNFVLNKFGNGEEEYQEIRNFTVDKNNIYILDNYRRKVYLYDAYTGEYKGKKDLSIVAWDIATLSDGKFLLTFVPNSGGNLKEKQSKYLIYITDNEFNVITGLLPYDENYSEPIGYIRYFTNYGDNVYFSSWRFDGVTIFPKENPENYTCVSIDFENKIPEEHRFDTEKVEQGSYNYLAGVPFFCSNYIAMEVVEGEFSENYLYCRKDSMFYRNPSDDAKNWSNAMLSPISCYQNKFVSVIPGYDIYDELVRKGFRRADHQVENSIKEGDWVLLFYTVK